MEVLSETEHKTSAMAVIVFCVLTLLGGFVCLICLWPCFCDRLKEVHHSCGKTGKHIGFKNWNGPTVIDEEFG